MAVELTKQAVATRLTRQAVRSYLRGDDELAVYLLASSAGRLLSDLLEKTGIDWLDLALRRSFFFWARDLSIGRYSGPPEILPWIEPIASKISTGEICGPESIALSGLDRQTRTTILRLVNRQYNFLKHADLDALTSLQEDEFDVYAAVAKACILFQDLFPELDVEEVYIFKYLLQRRLGFGFSGDVEPYPHAFSQIDDDQIMFALLNYLEFESPDD